MRETIVSLAIRLMERGLLPDFVVRKGIRNLCSQRLGLLRSTNEDTPSLIEKFVARMQQGPIAPVPEKANEQHYEVPAEFFQLCLGKHRKYSSCFWPSDTIRLDDAEAAALDATCRHAGIEDGMQVLDLGCGWGSMSLWLAEHYPNCEVTAVSNSQSQRQFIVDEAERRGFGNRVRVNFADMNDFSTDQQFDRIVSIEMFEHMRNYSALLRQIRNWLAPDGRLFVHLFCHKTFAYEFQDEGASNWMGRHFFTGGIMPSEDLLTHFSSDLQVVKKWRWSGIHYQATSNAWLRNLDENREQAMEILRPVYGSETKIWFHRWRLFYMACAELFAYDDGNEWYVSHYLLQPSNLAHDVKRPEPAPQFAR